MSSYQVSASREIVPADIQALRTSVGWDPDSVEAWQEALDKCLAVASVSHDGKLVGVGFLIGTHRHVVLADVCVSPDMQQQGIGSQIVDQLLTIARDCQYVTLTYDPANSWLADYYAKFGFQPISNAMQLRSDR